MKSTTLIFFVSVFLFVSNASAQSLRWQENYPDALKAAKDGKRSVLVYITGNDWCESCRRYRKDVLDHPTLAARIGDRYVAFEDDHPDRPDPERKKELDGKRRDFQYRTRKYPAVVLIDSENRRFLVLEKVGGTVEDLIAAVENAEGIKAARDVELEAAAKAEGPEKAKHLAAALELLGRSSIHEGNSHRRLLDELKKIDPEDSTGTVRRFNFNVDRFCEQSIWPLVRGKKYDDALELIAAEFADPRNDTELKQRLTALTFFVYREQPEKRDEALETLNELIALDDSTYMADLARGYVKYITEPIVLEGPEWDGRSLRFFFATWHLDAAPWVSKPGRYEIVFEKTRNENIDIRDAAFVVDGKESVKVEVPSSHNVVLDIPPFESDRPREFRFSVKGRGWFGSRGKIHIKPLDVDERQ